MFLPSLRYAGKESPTELSRHDSDADDGWDHPVVLSASWLLFLQGSMANLWSLPLDQAGLAINSQRSSLLLSAGIRAVCHHTWL